MNWKNWSHSESATYVGPDFRRYPFWKRWLGRRSERVAAAFLRGKGLRVVAQNVVDSLGELDLIAVDVAARTVVVVEVRSTSDPDPDRAAVTVNAAKQGRVARAALRFLASRNLLGVTVRFDVVAVAWPPGASRPTVAHYPGAFESPAKWQMWG